MYSNDNSFVFRLFIFKNVYTHYVNIGLHSDFKRFRWPLAASKLNGRVALFIGHVHMEFALLRTVDNQLIEQHDRTGPLQATVSISITFMGIFFLYSCAVWSEYFMCRQNDNNQINDNKLRTISHIQADRFLATSFSLSFAVTKTCANSNRTRAILKT